jgi:predicted  nucleic acid-binding Zn-ribbon protein
MCGLDQLREDLGDLESKISRLSDRIDDLMRERDVLIDQRDTVEGKITAIEDMAAAAAWAEELRAAPSGG